MPIRLIRIARWQCSAEAEGDKGSIRHPAARQRFSSGRVVLQSEGAPVEGLRERGTPIDRRSEALFEESKYGSVHTGGFGESSGLWGKGGGRGAVRQERGRDLARPLEAIVRGCRIGIQADFMLENPSQFPFQRSGGRIDGNTAVAQEGNAVGDPVPAILGTGEQDGDIVGEVPGVESPDIVVIRFECGNPVGQLHELDESALFLHSTSAEPEGVCDDSAKASEGCSGKGEQGRRFLHPLCGGGGFGTGDVRKAVGTQVQSGNGCSCADQKKPEREEEFAQIHIR